MFQRSNKESHAREHFLKRAASESEPGVQLDLTKLADDLGLSVQSLEDLLSEMEQSGLVSNQHDGWILTEKGWDQGRNLLRAHRIYESYLAEQTGLDPQKWHKEADRLEHELDSETVNRISLELNRPRFDPHGDAIPTRGLDMPAAEGVLLPQVSENGYYRIVHIEDEPPEPFAKVIAAGLAPELIVHVEVLNGGRFRLQWAGLEHYLDSAQAAALMVNKCQAEELEFLPKDNLYNLKDGASATIHSISPAVRGLERRRLLDLGFVPGSTVIRESSGAFNGPVRFIVRGTVQALRREQASNIYVE
ncbi:MAG: metal-dependent transcriptional regulator [Verrucomicrobiae bacterium]|nr:metal-dependent transcriptional regulator [Verrucomicrobiae bacterium]